MTTIKDLPKEHLRQIKEGRVASLTRAGIPANLWERDLTTIDCGVQVGEWLRTEGAQSIKDGQSWFLDTRGRDTNLVMPLTARVLHLNSIGCRLLRLSQLVRLVECREYDELNGLATPTALFVQGFYSATLRSADRPFNAFQRAAIQDLLLNRAADGKANVLQLTNPKGVHGNIAEWWDDELIEGLRAKAVTVSP